jgi:RNA 2',3'-cyclic 3'-phosphodiesterase
VRLFIAIELPDYLKTALGRLQSDISDARWVPAEQIHLTLSFLGEVDEKTAEQLTEELGNIQESAFKLSFTGTGCFPNRHHPRVVWVGVKPEPALTRLAARIHTAVLACGIPQEERPFSPHITLARLKLPCSRELGAFLDQHREVKLKTLSVAEFTLFQSRLTQQGALHVPVRIFPLQVDGDK